MNNPFTVRERHPVVDVDTKFADIKDLVELTVANGMRNHGYSRVLRLNIEGLICDPHYVKSIIKEESLLSNELKDFILVWSKDINEYIEELESICSTSSSISQCLLD